jgi:hypothetical protein
LRKIFLILFDVYQWSGYIPVFPCF